MTSSEVIELIANTDRINADHTDELEMLVSRYPWFAAGHILLAKAHKNAGRHSYKNLLKKASLYAGDRSLLLRLMEEPEKQVSEKDLEQEPVIKPQLDQTPEKEEQQEPPKETTRKAEPAGTNGSGNAIEEFLRSFGSGEEQIEKQEQEEKQEGKQEEPLEEQILYELHHIQPEQGLEPEIEETDEGEEEPILQDIPFRTGQESGEEEDQDSGDTAEPEDGRHAEIIYDPIRELGKLAGEEDVEDETAGHEEVPVVPAYDPEVELAAIIEQREAEDDQEESAEDSDHHSFLNWLDEYTSKSHKPDEQDPKRSAGKKNEKQSGPKKADASELLETFLKKKPRISRMKAEFYNPETMARKSETDDSDIVSESLARLLLKQGHAEKAIAVYEKLKLQMPTNLAYFAARITEIKEEYNIG